MVVVDIRNFFTIRNVELIEINYDTIYYAEEKNEEGHNNLFVPRAKSSTASAISAAARRWTAGI